MIGKKKKELLKCSFCGKMEEEVSHLIASGNGAYACKECIEVMVTILHDDNVEFKGIIVKNAEEFKSAEEFKGQVTKSLEFPPEYKQSAMSILSYFGEVVSQKYPDVNVKIRIEQEGLIVRMTIETIEGQLEKIERALECYGLVIQGKEAPEKLLSDPLHIMQLKHKIQMATMELKHTRDLLDYSKEESKDRIDSLEKEVTRLHNIIGQSLQTANNAFTLLDDMIESNKNNLAVTEALKLINDKIKSGISELDEKEIKAALTVIHNDSPGTLVKIKDFVISSLSGVAGNFLYSWILSIMS